MDTAVLDEFVIVSENNVKSGKYFLLNYLLSAHYQKLVHNNCRIFRCIRRHQK